MFLINFIHSAGRKKQEYAVHTCIQHIHSATPKNNNNRLPILLTQTVFTKDIFHTVISWDELVRFILYYLFFYSCHMLNSRRRDEDRICTLCYGIGIARIDD